MTRSITTITQTWTKSRRKGSEVLTSYNKRCEQFRKGASALVCSQGSSLRRSPAPEARNYKMKLKPAGENAKKIDFGQQSLLIPSTRALFCNRVCHPTRYLDQCCCMHCALSLSNNTQLRDCANTERPCMIIRQSTAHNSVRSLISNETT